ncbi:MAG: hypothetical protein M3Q27_10590 [Actinomycetota bacterium]|nr:hypothetical protein [Actinomycetota bacterium]
MSRPKRPVMERWWWYFLMSAWAWLRLLAWPFSEEHSRLDVVALVVVAGSLPLWFWIRWHEDRRRSESPGPDAAASDRA